jgi:threonine/homoserine/homoserine lactone efflux protein
MNTAEFFIKGLIVGFLIAAPVGPVAVMCIHRTIARGRIAGYVCGLGATTADTIFGVIAALGLGFIASELLAFHDWLRIGGGIILVALGLRIVLSRHLSARAEQQEAQEEREERAPSPLAASRLDYHIGNFVAAFAIMITNPITLVSFAAVFAFIDIAHVNEQARWGAALITGVFLGAGTWWTILVLITGRFHQNVTENGLLWVNRISGALILICGLVLLLLPTGFLAP